MTDRLLLRRARLLDRAGLHDLVIEDGVLTGIETAGDQPTGVDVAERIVIPGLWDTHVHFDQWAGSGHRLDLTEADSAEAATSSVAARIAARPPADGEVLVGVGFRYALWADQPSLRALDSASGVVPVLLMAGDLHTVWVNSAACDLLGIAAPADGLLREDDCMDAIARLASPTPEVGDRLAAEAVAAAAARGIVGIVDFENAPNRDGWVRRVRTGLRDIRVEAAFYSDRVEDALATGLRSGDAVPGTDGLIRMGPLKVITDGSLNTRTAYCHQPFPGPGAQGMLLVPRDRLEALVRRCHDHGITSALHAIGDRANHEILNVFEATGATGSIEHVQLLDDADVSRFASLGVVASVQPRHAVDDRDVADALWAGRTARAYRFADLLAAGATVRFGSDAPVAPLDPWLAIASAVRRSDDERPSWHPEQQLTVAQAIACSTRSGLTPAIGSPADLAILDADPHTAPDLATLPVAGTLLAGRWTHRVF